MPTFTCDLSHQPKFDHFWEHSIGSGPALLAMRVDWRCQLERASDELAFAACVFTASCRASCTRQARTATGATAF